MAKLIDYRGAFLAAKYFLIFANLTQIVLILLILANNWSQLSRHESTSNLDTTQKDLLFQHKLLNIFSCIMLILIYTIGILGSYKEHHCVVLTNGSILGLLAFFNWISPVQAGLVNFVLPLVMSSLAICYAVLLSLRKQAAGHHLDVPIVVLPQ